MGDELRERIADTIAKANKAWPTLAGSPVKELFVADAVIDSLPIERAGWLCSHGRLSVNQCDDDDEPLYRFKSVASAGQPNDGANAPTTEGGE